MPFLIQPPPLPLPPLNELEEARERETLGENCQIKGARMRERQIKKEKESGTNRMTQ